jgi:endonuclease/exonuclease/phosphatase family metal-dependent hydrolase
VACSGRVDILSYNVENLFDDRDSGLEYPEFRGPRWGAERYSAKLAAVARAIRSSCPGGPDLVALQEVESERALADLRDRHLAGLGYRHLVFVPQPGAVTGVAFLSRLPVLRTHVLSVGFFEGEPLRHIVEIEVERRGHRLRVLNNHWKSKTEGVERTAPGRDAAAEVLARRVGKVLTEDPAADLVALGDFNQNLEELESWTRKAGLHDPWIQVPPERRGSAVFRGDWQTPDHVLLSPGLLDQRGFAWRRGGFRVVTLGFLREARTGFPRRFASGGASDHLPLLLRLRVRK